MDEIWPHTCDNKVDLPAPGSPPNKVTEPSYIPPPSTLSSSWISVLRQNVLTLLSISLNRNKALSLPPQFFADPFVDGPSENSSIVFHALHSVHCPCHLTCSAPHSRHTYVFFAFAINNLLY